MTKTIQPQPDQEKKPNGLQRGFLGIPKVFISIGEKFFFLIVLALAVYYFLPKISSIEETLKVLQSLKFWGVLLALTAQVLSYWGSGIMMNESIKLAGHRISIVRGMLISLASYSIGLVAGGMFGSAANTFRWVKASGGGNEGASLAASLPPIFVDIVLAVVSVFGLIFLLFSHNLSTAQAFSFFLIALLLIAIGLILFIAVRHQDKAIPKTIQILSRIYKILKKPLDAEKVTKDLQRLFNIWGFLLTDGWKGPLLGAAISIFFDMWTVYFLFIACGSFISPVIFIAGYGLPLLFGRMAFMFPGGVGIIESTMVALYTSLGIDNSLATVVVLTYRVISFWLPSISGFFLLPFFNKITKNGSVELKNLREDF